MIINGNLELFICIQRFFSLHKLIFVSFVIWATVLYFGSASYGDENWQTKGEGLYRRGNMDEARECFVQALKRQPKNLISHYYLGLISMRTKDDDLAAKEFKFVISSGPGSAEAKLSYQALTVLNGAGAKGTTVSSTLGNQSEKRSIKQAVSDIQLQTNRSKNIAAKEEAQADEILKEADEKASALEAEAKQRQIEMSKAVYYGLESSYGSDGLYRSLMREYPIYTANEISAACDGLVLKAAQIRDQAAKKVLEIRSQIKLKELATEKSALVVERQLIDRPISSSVKMQSEGTNLYVRNYETSSQGINNGSSGQVALLGQAKLLISTQDKEKKTKVSQ